MLTIYVDDILAYSNSDRRFDEFKQGLEKKYRILICFAIPKNGFIDIFPTSNIPNTKC
jgi:hypothetical protein